VVRWLALAAFLVFVIQLFRFAMGLREAKRQRESERAAEEARGRRVVAEIPLGDGGIVLLTEDERGFLWGDAGFARSEIAGARLLLNGGILREFARGPGERLPPPVPPEEFEGRERWEVAVFLKNGGVARIPCGTLREGVSREIAGRVYAAVERASASSLGLDPQLQR
jgi:hypothetical protein